MADPAAPDPSRSGNALYSTHWHTGIGELGILVAASINNIGNRTDEMQTGRYPPIAGATEPTLSLQDVVVEAAGDYTVQVSNSAGSALSSPATLIIVASPAYHGGVSGLVKNALDYVEDLRDAKRPYLDGRAVGCIACAGGWQAAVATLTGLRSISHALRGWPTPLQKKRSSAAFRMPVRASATEGGSGR